MKEPKRLDFNNGIWGDVEYLKQLNKYCNYLKKENKQLKNKKNDYNEEKLIELWYKRNPIHELNQKTGKDMFYESLFLVFKDYIN